MICTIGILMAILEWCVYKYDHVSLILRRLPAPQRIDYKIAVLVYRSVSARTCSGVPVCWSIEHQGPAVETATTVIVVRHVSRPYIKPVHCQRLRLPIAAGRVWNTLSPDVRLYSSLSAFKRWLKTELFSRSFPDWCDCVNFCPVCKVASQLWPMPP